MNSTVKSGGMKELEFRGTSNCHFEMFSIGDILILEKNRIETFKKHKIDATPSYVLEHEKGKLRDISGQNPNLLTGFETLLLSSVIGPIVGLFHSVGEAIAKPRLPMAFLGQTEER